MLDPTAWGPRLHPAHVFRSKEWQGCRCVPSRCAHTEHICILQIPVHIHTFIQTYIHICTYTYTWSATDQTDTQSTQTSTGSTNTLMLFPSLAKQDGSRVRGSLQQLRLLALLSSCPWIPVSPVAGTWTYGPLKLLIYSSYWHSHTNTAGLNEFISTTAILPQDWRTLVVCRQP